VTLLARKSSSDPRVAWEARISDDRGRLAVVAVISPTTEAIVIELPTERELRELLTVTPDVSARGWACPCGQFNEPGRAWCRACSAHQEGPS
jgi:hypothetical protein